MDFFGAGVGRVLYCLERLDEHYEGYAKDATQLRLAPGEYLRRQCFVSCEPDERELPHAIAVLGAERIVFACD